MKTADLTDEHSNYQLCDPVFKRFGGLPRFHGPVRTVKAFEDFSLVRDTVSEKAEGAVLVIDGHGSRRCAMFGDRLAQMAVDNGWSGAIINGLIRDSAEIDQMPFGIRALGVTPLRSANKGLGKIEVSVQFAGVTFDPGNYVYVDEDGIIVCSEPLVLPE